MTQFHFTARHSHVYTNLRNKGRVFYIHSPDPFQGTNFKEMVINICQMSGDIHPSLIHSTVLGESIEDKFKEYCDPKVLIINMQSIYLNDTYIQDVYMRIARERAKWRKTTFFIDHHSKDFKGYDIHPDVIKMNTSFYMEGAIIDALMKDSYFQAPKNYENVLFLDIDGVLLPYRGFMSSRWSGTHCGEFLEDPVKSVQAFDDDAVSFLGKLCNEQDISIILCSQWRIGLKEQGCKDLGRYLGLPIMGKTVNGGNRDVEIQCWIDHYKPTGVLSIIDDEPRAVKDTHALKINPRNGITWEDMEELCELYNTNIYNFTNSKFEYK